MSNHTGACQHAQSLCDHLLNALTHRIPDLQSSRKSSWCTVGTPHFAYISHMRTSPRIQIWCKGDPAALEKDRRVNYHPRPKPRRGWWEKNFSGWFDVEHIEDIDAAAEVLYQHSYSRT